MSIHLIQYTSKQRDKSRVKRQNGVVSCWLCSLALETAGTHKGREPFLTGHPGVMGSLWENENIVLTLLEFMESRGNAVKIQYCFCCRYLSDAGLSLRCWTGMTGLKMVWIQLCQPEPPGTPAGVCPCRQIAAGLPRFLALFSPFYLMSKGKIFDYDEHFFNKAVMAS